VLVKAGATARRLRASLLARLIAGRRGVLVRRRFRLWPSLIEREEAVRTSLTLPWRASFEQSTAGLAQCRDGGCASSFLLFHLASIVRIHINS